MRDAAAAITIYLRALQKITVNVAPKEKEEEKRQREEKKKKKRRNRLTEGAKKDET